MSAKPLRVVQLNSTPQRTEGMPMMGCGHRANGIDRRTGKPVCVICVGIVAGADQVVGDPVLADRMARCTYYGKPFRVSGRGSCECDVCGSTVGLGCCWCERPSSDEELAFFGHKPSEEFDEFYCGCHGWD